MVEITTNVDFKRVEWNLGGTPKKTDNGTENGTDTYSAFTPALDGLGRPWGLRRAVTATAYGNDGTSVSRTIWFRVWSASSYIGIVKMSGPSDVVVGESLTVDLETNAGFERVDWYIGKADQPSRSTYGPAYKASFTHTFGDGMGSDDENGKPRQIKAKAYALGSPNGDPVKPAKDAFTLNVHEGKGKILRDAVASVDYFDVTFQYNADGEVESGLVDIGFGAGIYYYNDLEDADAEVYSFLYACKQRRNIWDQLMRPNSTADSFRVFHAPENKPEGEEYWNPKLELSFDTAVFGHFEMENVRFETGTEELPNFYYAFTKAHVHQDPNEEWVYRYEDKSGDGTNSNVDTDDTEPREFPKEWSQGFNFP